MEEIDECAQRACLRIALVTVMHSVTTNATGSIATVILLPVYPSKVDSAMVNETSKDTIRVSSISCFVRSLSKRDQICC